MVNFRPERVSNFVYSPGKAAMKKCFSVRKRLAQVAAGEDSKICELQLNLCGPTKQKETNIQSSYLQLIQEMFPIKSRTLQKAD